MAEFLPLCDVLFNVISLAGYFCDVVFDVVMGYALLERGFKGTFAATISIVLTSLIISQRSLTLSQIHIMTSYSCHHVVGLSRRRRPAASTFRSNDTRYQHPSPPMPHAFSQSGRIILAPYSVILSLRWYLHVCEGTEGRRIWMPILLHCLQLGVLWRYAKLFVPVDLRNVKHEVRDLCMLRLVHAFCEAAPMLLLQLHILFRDNEDPETSDLVQSESIDEPTANKTFAELNVISASLSLFSVCWALASFSKNVRLQNVHRLVLTWLGVIFQDGSREYAFLKAVFVSRERSPTADRIINGFYKFQFLWRLGTITARMCALTLYALVYRYWVFLVIGLHWVSMFLWLISPKNVFHGERISKPRKAYLSALIAFVYVFAYINLQELNHRQKMITFYCVMLIENCLLVGAWAAGHSGGRHSPTVVAASMLASFLTGLAFMLIYYRYFHVRRLGYILGEQQGTNSTNNSNQSKNGMSITAGGEASITFVTSVTMAASATVDNFNSPHPAVGCIPHVTASRRQASNNELQQTNTVYNGGDKCDTVYFVVSI
ncbi:XK-related protein 4 [Eumeta japonica]|uniref:XK-related protein n=1 Tax=Eumeta variegata TaxID=151549 RepID=A0A4C1SAQ4_EUMVA|nr:XK-related protein 4 [Eumeta japonica]